MNHLCAEISITGNLADALPIKSESDTALSGTLLERFFPGTLKNMLPAKSDLGVAPSGTLLERFFPGTLKNMLPAKSDLGATLDETAPSTLATLHRFKKGVSACAVLSRAAAEGRH
ncbi:MAG: hypothetical protein IJQ81_08190 [Oscillibacter sp.]|nr:hypothetical protein [Oscillibacter sp.]